MSSIGYTEKKKSRKKWVLSGLTTTKELDFRNLTPMQIDNAYKNSKNIIERGVAKADRLEDCKLIIEFIEKNIPGYNKF